MKIFFWNKLICCWIVDESMYWMLFGAFHCLWINVLFTKCMILCYFWATDYCAVCVSPFVVFLANYLLIGNFLWIKTCLFHYFVEQMLRCNYLLYAYNILASILLFNTQCIDQQYWLILKCQNIIFVTELGASTVYYVHNVLLWFGAKSIAVVMHAFTHWRAWLADS